MVRGILWVAMLGMFLVSLTLPVSAVSPVSVSSPSPDSVEVGSGEFVSVDVRAKENVSTVSVEAKPSSGLEVSGGNPVSVGTLDDGESVEASFWVRAKDSASSGLHGIKFRVTGTDSGGDAFSYSRDETLLVSGSSGGIGLEVEAPALSVGDGGELSVDVSAPSGEEVRGLEVSLVSTEDSSPVEVVGSRSREVGDLSARERGRVVFDLSSAVDASPGVYGFRVVVDHSSGSVSRELGVEVEGSPELVVDGEALPGTRGWVVEGNLSNVGTSSVQSVVVRLGSGSSDFLGSVSAGEAKGFEIELKGMPEGRVGLNVSFRDSGSEGSASFEVPVSSVSPELSVTGVDVERGPGNSVLSGTISNRGEAEASGLVVSVEDGSGVVPVYPSKSYFVGDLEPGDFASFELTFRGNGSSEVNVSLDYRSGGGEREVRSFSLPESVSGSSGGSSDGVPVSLLTGVLAVVGVGVVGAVVYSWRD